MAENANVIWADGPSASPANPPKSQIRTWGTSLESRLSTVETSNTDVGARLTAAETADAALATRVTTLEGSSISGIKMAPQWIEARSTGNVALATGLVNGQTLNGVTVATGKFYFLGSQTDKSENGIYVGVASGTATRATWADSAAELAHIGFVIRGGTTGAGERWTLPLDADDITVGTTDLVFAPAGIEPGTADITAAKKVADIGVNASSLGVNGGSATYDASALKWTVSWTIGFAIIGGLSIAIDSVSSADLGTTDALYIDLVNDSSPYQVVQSGLSAIVADIVAGKKLLLVRANGATLQGPLAASLILGALSATVANNTGYTPNGTAIPDPSLTPAGLAVIQDGEDDFQCLSKTTAWTPINRATPDVPMRYSGVLHFGRRRYWQRGTGYKTMTLTCVRASEKWARDLDGVYHKFAANVPALTDRGLYADQGYINFAFCSRDLTITHIAGIATDKTFTDGETLTAGGGGSGTYVASQKETNWIPIRGGSGTFSGTLTGGDSEVEATITTVRTVWVATNMTVARTEDGADGVSNSATRLTATAANATIMQTIDFATSVPFAFGAVVRRVTGTGTVYMTMDGGTTWTEVTLTDDFAPMQIPYQSIANPEIGFKLATSGDEIAVDFVMVVAGAVVMEPVVSKATRAVSSGDKISMDIATFAALKSAQRTLVVGATPMNNYSTGGGVFASVDNGSHFERVTLDFALKSTYPTDNIMIGVTLEHDSEIIGIDPPNNIPIGSYSVVGYSIDCTAGTMYVALNGTSADASEVLSSFGTDYIADQSSNTRFWIGNRDGFQPMNGYLHWLAIGDDLITEETLGDDCQTGSDLEKVLA